MSLRHGVRLLRPPGSTANPMNICRQTHRILTRSRHFSCSSYVSNSNASSQLLFPNQVRPSLRSQGTVNPNYSQFKSLVTINSNLSDSLKKNEIISDVLDSFTPSSLITISYGENLEVTMGNTLKPSETQVRPEIHATFNADDSESVGPSDLFTYTLVMTDPDAPSRTDKTYSEYAHHIVTGLKLSSASSDFAAIDFSTGNEILPYMGPAPPEKTGKHRYVYILFRETQGSPKSYEGERARWGTETPGTGVRSWAAKHGLIPIAANFYFAQNDVQ